MSVQLFILRGVPEDEADEVRQLLSREAVDFFETPAGNWGISMPAIWIRDDGQLVRAQELLAAYQRERQIRVRDAYDQAKRAGDAPTVIDKIRLHPLRFFLQIVAAAFVLYVSTKPFLFLAGPSE